MADCPHTWTQGRDGEKGSWCNACGEKVMEVETRPCEGCANYRDVVNGSVCKKHLMAVSPVMLVTFKIAEGTCWEERHNSDCTEYRRLSGGKE
jgi:hypothetical protein